MTMLLLETWLKSPELPAADTSPKARGSRARMAMPRLSSRSLSSQWRTASFPPSWRKMVTGQGLLPSSGHRSSAGTSKSLSVVMASRSTLRASWAKAPIGRDRAAEGFGFPPRVCQRFLRMEARRSVHSSTAFGGEL